MEKIKHDSLPERFQTIDAFIKFWDTHDTEDHPDAWREISVVIKMKARKYPRTAAHQIKNQKSKIENLEYTE